MELAYYDQTYIGSKVAELANVTPAAFVLQVISYGFPPFDIDDCEI